MKRVALIFVIIRVAEDYFLLSTFYFLLIQEIHNVIINKDQTRLDQRL